MAADTVWVKASDITVTIGGTPQKCTDCQISRTAGEFETTNLTSPKDSNGLLQYEGGNDVVTTKLSGTNVVDSEAAAALTLGTIIAASFAVTGEETTAGSVRINEITKTGSPKGGFQVKWAGTFVGAVTTS